MKHLVSKRIQKASGSVTLKVSEEINKLSLQGRHVYNMTAGQLSFKPSSDFIRTIDSQLNFLKSYQYPPVAGFRELRDKVINHIAHKREVDLTDFESIVSNGSKHSLYNLFGALIDPGDEVILLSPYWVSYPEMIQFWGGKAVAVRARGHDSFIPVIEEIAEQITDKTKAIIVNSPNNPAGVHYDRQWMEDFGSLVQNYPEILLISDEIYSDIYYFDPPPIYFYQVNPALLSRTFIIDGISKSFAATGLRIGYCIGDKDIIDSMTILQSQTTSGANALIQQALIDFDFNKLETFFDPVKDQLRQCAYCLMEVFRDAGLSHCWYQTTSAYYFLLDFSKTPIMNKYSSQGGSEDFSQRIVEDILNATGVGLVPGSQFGISNSARLSMTIELAPFREGLEKLVAFISEQ